MPECFAWPAIKRDFDTNGFVRIPGFLAPAQAAEAARRLEMFIRDIVPKIPAREVYYEIEGRADAIKSITSLAEHDPYFRDLYNGENFIAAASRLLGGPARPPSVHQLNKPAKVGKPTQPHQDAAYLSFPPGNSLTLWLALEAAASDNGAMIYLRGSHLRGLQPHYDNGSNYFAKELAAYEGYGSPDEIRVCAAPGDLLAHHSLTIHRTEDNRTERSRNALIADFILDSAKDRDD